MLEVFGAGLNYIVTAGLSARSAISPRCSRRPSRKRSRRGLSTPCSDEIRDGLGPRLPSLAESCDFLKAHGQAHREFQILPRPLDSGEQAQKPTTWSLGRGVPGGKERSGRGWGQSGSLVP